ncbi:MAG: DsbA family protein [Actinomycetota bacterium]|nr:DsbA family protein [Actinomycetota bacterium]
MTPPPPGTVVVWSDLACPWAHVAIARFRRMRDELGLAGDVRLDHRAFPLEVINRRPTPKLVLDAEVPVAGALEPAAGWQMWRARESAYPGTVLLALEAVQAAKEQSLEASEALDAALRRALFAESRCISLRSVVLDVAGECEAVDAGVLAKTLDDGRARRTLMDQAEEAAGAGIQGSPHFFLPDGTDVHNPGVRFHWEGEKGRGFPVVDADDPSVYEDMLRRTVLPVGG